MIFQPVNEKHLEHIVSTEFFSKNCKIEYCGPVLTQSNKVSDSPDMLVLDKRNGKAIYKTCECKFSPSNYRDFEHNGFFDIAIIWDFNCDFEKLKTDLFKYNKCKEIIVLSRENVFSKLPKYKNFLNNTTKSNPIYNDKFVRKLKIGKDYTSFVAFIAAKIYPNRFSSEKMMNILENNYETVKNLHAKVKANAVSALTQPISKGDNQRFLLRQWNNTYKWNNEIVDSTVALSIIVDIISNYFTGKFPSVEDIQSVEVK